MEDSTFQFFGRCDALVRTSETDAGVPQRPEVFAEGVASGLSEVTFGCESNRFFVSAKHSVFR